MNTCEATPSAAQEIRIQSLGTPEIDSPLSRNLATAGERRVVFTVAGGRRRRAAPHVL